jgi:hypothetical protein
VAGDRLFPLVGEAVHGGGSPCGTTHSPAVPTVFGTPANTGPSVCGVEAGAEELDAHLEVAEPGWVAIKHHRQLKQQQWEPD